MNIRYGLLTLLMISCLLAGCSRQSVSDFTPYPSEQGTVVFSLHPVESKVTTASGVEVIFDSVFLGVARVVPTVTTAGQRAASVRAHEAEEPSEASGAPISGTENQEGTDDRALVDVSLTVGKVISLLEETMLGSLALRAGGETGWKLVLEPYSAGSRTGTILLSGKVKKNGLESAITVVMPEVVEIEFPVQETVTAGIPAERGLAFDAARWFEGLPLETLVGSGPVVIDKDHHDLLHPFVENLIGSVQAQDTHYHDEGAGNEE